MMPTEAAALFKLLRAAYPNARIPEDAAQLWLSELRKLDHERGSAAVRSLIAGCKFWPSLAELYEQYRIIGEQQARARREQERCDAAQAFDAIPMPPLREIPAAVQLLRRFNTPLPLDPATDGACDDCGRSGQRFTRGRLRLCGDCARRRLSVASQLDQEPEEGVT